jgi:CHASE3 domain sensor protein
MSGSWTFGRKVGLGFAAAVAFTVAVGGIAIWALNAVKDAEASVDGSSTRERRALQAHVSFESVVASVRGYFLTVDPSLLPEITQDWDEFHRITAELTAASVSEVDREMSRQAETIGGRFEGVAGRMVELRRTGGTLETILPIIKNEGMPLVAQLTTQLDAYVVRSEQMAKESKAQSLATSAVAETTLLVVMAAALALCIVLAVWLTRSLTRQIGAAVQQVQSSSAELQAAATQQASGAKEQSTALNEVTTTMKELLATSQQIAENAQRVAKIAEDTASSSAAGDLTGRTAQDAIGGIKRQVDVIARHMLELGKRSQQIGTVLDIIGELAEQTNILAINATIEAAGAGEAGRRFAVVADEVRKLADRVGGSTKEIRTLIEEIRTATNTTVMATEDGAKAVDAGLRQFADVEGSFRKVAALAGTAMESAKEIGMSTRQQASAVEQVNGAIGDVAQAAKETEVSTRQTLDTVGQLLALSTDLAKIVRSQARAQR